MDDRDKEIQTNATLKAIGLIGASLLYPNDDGSKALDIIGIDMADPQDVGTLIGGLHNLCLVLVGVISGFNDDEPFDILKKAAETMMNYGN